MYTSLIGVKVTIFIPAVTRLPILTFIFYLIAHRKNLNSRIMKAPFQPADTVFELISFYARHVFLRFLVIPVLV